MGAVNACQVGRSHNWFRQAGIGVESGLTEWEVNGLPGARNGIHERVRFTFVGEMVVGRSQGLRRSRRRSIGMATERGYVPLAKADCHAAFGGSQ
jgi:hypothetical protein